MLGVNQHCRIWPSVVTQIVYFKMGKCKPGKADDIWEDRAYINLFVRGINFQWFIIPLVQHIAQKYTSLFAKAAQLPLEEWGLFFPSLLQGWADVKQRFTILWLRIIKASHTYWNVFRYVFCWRTTKEINNFWNFKEK